MHYVQEIKLITKKRRSVEFTLGADAFASDYNLGQNLYNGTDARVAILGGGNIKEGAYYNDACDFAKNITKLGFSVITGGGSGIMEACNKGASSVENAKSYGVRVKVLPTEQQKNNYINQLYEFNTLSIRLLSIISACDAAVFFPGGFGTLEELFAILVRMRVGMMNKIPVFLYSKSYWQGMLSWINQSLIPAKVIDQTDAHLLQIVNSTQELIDKISSSLQHQVQTDNNTNPTT